MVSRKCFIAYLAGMATGMGFSIYMGLDRKNYTPERKQRLINALKGK